jgi:hypothetical protein
LGLNDRPRLKLNWNWKWKWKWKLRIRIRIRYGAFLIWLAALVDKCFNKIDYWQDKGEIIGVFE